MPERLNEICAKCGYTLGSHCGSAYYSSFYKMQVPHNACPGHEGMIGWSMETTFTPTKKFKGEKGELNDLSN